MTATQIHSTVDFDRPGKQHGHLCVPYSYNLGGWANLMVPVTVVNNGSGRRRWSWPAITATNIRARWPSCD